MLPVVVLLAVIDLIFIGLHIAHALAVRDGLQTPFRDQLFNINRDGGLAEWFEYAKSLTSAAALFLCFRSRAWSVFAVLAGLHLWILADNSLRLHEQIGALIGQSWIGGDVAGVISARDAGQIVLHGLVLATAGVLFAFTAVKAPRPLRPTLGILFLAAISPGLFGVVVDAFHASSLSAGIGRGWLVLIEDGGETLMLSLGCALAVGCYAALRARDERGTTWMAAAT